MAEAEIGSGGVHTLEMTPLRESHEFVPPPPHSVLDFRLPEGLLRSRSRLRDYSSNHRGILLLGKSSDPEAPKSKFLRTLVDLFYLIVHDRT